MDKSRKNLKEASILVLAWTAVSFIRTIVDMITGVRNITPDPAKGVTEGIILASIIVYGVIGVLIMIPQVYISIKGIQISKNPDSASSRAHIVWAKVLFVIAILSLASPIASMVETGKILSNTLALADALLDVALFSLYIRYAGEVAKGE